MHRRLVLALPLLLSACVATTTTSRTWSEPYGRSWARYGRVESVRETIHRQHGDPAGGAVAGAFIGGLLGSAWTGRPGGAFAGAVGGALVGAAASQGQAEQRIYEVFVRFDDGSLETFVYRDALPFEAGEQVVLTAHGLSRYRSPEPPAEGSRYRG